MSFKQVVLSGFRELKKEKMNFLSTFVRYVQQFAERKMKAARRAVTECYASSIPAAIVWRKGLEAEDDGLEKRGSTAWVAQRLYLAQLGVYAAETVKRVRLFWLIPLAALITFLIAVLGELMSPYGLAHHYVATFFLLLLVLGLYFFLGTSPISYRTLLPNKLLNNEELNAIDNLMARVVLRTSSENTPADLQDRFRNLVVDAEGDSVSGQIISADMDVAFFTDQLYRSLFAWLIIPLLFLIGFYGYIAVAAIVFVAWFMVELMSHGPLKARSLLSAAASNECASEYLADTASRSYYKLQENARVKQQYNAANDKSPFILLGKSTGIFFERRDVFSPSEADMPFGLTVEDLSTHLLALGATGTGKTSGVIRPILRQWLSHDIGGLLVLDGKGQLPNEVTDMDANYQVISPEHDAYNPIENLTPDEIADSFHAVFAGQATDPFWEDSATAMLRFAAILLHYSSADYTLHNLYRLCSVNEFQIQIAKEVPADVTGGLLLAIEYFARTLPTMPEKTRGSIVGVVQTWMFNLIGNEKLAKWVAGPSGVCIEAVLDGKRYGIALPESRYGKGGVLISMLSQRRLYCAIKNRGDNWWKTGGKPVLFLADEIQNLVSTQDLDMLPIARSLGLYCVWSTQNMDGIERKLGHEDAEQLIGNLSNMVALPARTHASESMIANRLGKIWRSVADTHDSFPDAYSDMARYVHNGADKWSSATYNQRLQKTGSSVVARNTLQDTLEVVREWSTRFWRAIGIKGDIQELSANQMLRDRINHVKIATTHLVFPDEINAMLACPNTAIAQVIRGRVIRRDVIQLQPEFPGEKNECL